MASKHQHLGNPLLPIHRAPAASTTPTRLLLQSTPSTPMTGRGRERSTTELEETSEPRMKSAFKKHCSALTPPERKSCFSSLSQRMILGVRHWQRLWPCSSLSDAAGNACTCSSRPGGIWATNRESGEWWPAAFTNLHASTNLDASHGYNTASSASSVSSTASAASAGPAAFRDGRTDRLLPCDISVGVCLVFLAS